MGGSSDSMIGIGSMVLDEIRETERAVRLLDLFHTPSSAHEKDVFRIVADEGVMYEMDLFGNWTQDNDRLIEFDRPPVHKIRIYGQPSYRLIREAVFGDGSQVKLYEMSASYSDVDVKPVLKEAGVHNLAKLEDDVPVEKFIRMCAAPKTGTMRRWMVHAPVDGRVQVEQRTTSVMGETLFENVVEALMESGAGNPTVRYLVLEGNELAQRVRYLVRGVTTCTYWDDETCLEFATLVKKQGTVEIQESIRTAEKEAFDDFIYRCRTGGEVLMDGVREFIESRSYPGEREP